MQIPKYKPLVLATIPHVFSKASTQRLMLNVIIALVPTLIASVYIFGLRALLVLTVTTLACVIFEFAWCAFRNLPQTVGDLSAVVTGLLLACNLPASIPLYMAVIGAFIAIIGVKELFGGIGKNFVNPAIAARLILAVSFTAAMTSFPLPERTLFGVDTIDAVSAATPLAHSAPDPQLIDLIFGVHTGVLGETCGAALLLGLVYLLLTRTIDASIPGVYLATVALFAWATGHPVLPQIFSGGLLLGAIFMATDYVTSPATLKGKVIYAIGLGCLTCLIRYWGNMNEGVAFSILLMNLVVPFIDDMTAMRPLGAPKKTFFGKNRGSHGAE